jgi:hypothetical protein
MNRTLTLSKLWLPLVVALTALFSSRAHAQQPEYRPDWYMVTTTAAFRPVAVPGTQRRVAQNDAELKARKLLYEHAGSLPVGRGKTVNDVVSHDARLKGKLLELMRTAELVDWQVNPACGCVQVWVRIDLNVVRGLIAACGYR